MQNKYKKKRNGMCQFPFDFKVIPDPGDLTNMTVAVDVIVNGAYHHCGTVSFFQPIGAPLFVSKTMFAHEYSKSDIDNDNTFIGRVRWYVDAININTVFTKKNHCCYYIDIDQILGKFIQDRLNVFINGDIQAKIDYLTADTFTKSIADKILDLINKKYSELLADKLFNS